MEHHGGEVDWYGWLIGDAKSARHLVLDAQFPEVREMQWDSEGFGNAVWFDSAEEASAFISEKFPISKTKNEQAKQTKYMPIMAEHLYRQMLGLRRIVKSYAVGDAGDRIAVVEEATGKVVDDNHGQGFRTEEEAWTRFGRNRSKSWQEEAFWRKKFERMPKLKGILERIKAMSGELGVSERAFDFGSARCMALSSVQPIVTLHGEGTEWVAEDGHVVVDTWREFKRLQKEHGRLFADSKRKKWKARHYPVSWGIFQHYKFWEVSGVVCTAAGGMTARTADARGCANWMEPCGCVRERTLEEVLAREDIKGKFRVMEGPRECVAADWLGSPPFVAMAKARLGLPQGPCDRIWTDGEIIAITLGAQKAVLDFWRWELEQGIAKNQGRMVQCPDPERAIAEEVEWTGEDTAERLLAHNDRERELARLIAEDRDEQKVSGSGGGNPVQGELALGLD